MFPIINVYQRLSLAFSINSLTFLDFLWHKSHAPTFTDLPDIGQPLKSKFHFWQACGILSCLHKRHVMVLANFRFKAIQNAFWWKLDFCKIATFIKICQILPKCLKKWYWQVSMISLLFLYKVEIPKSWITHSKAWDCFTL